MKELLSVDVVGDRVFLTFDEEFHEILMEEGFDPDLKDIGELVEVLEVFTTWLKEETNANI